MAWDGVYICTCMVYTLVGAAFLTGALTDGGWLLLLLLISMQIDVTAQ